MEALQKIIHIAVTQYLTASSIFKSVFDALIYAIATGLIFAVFWPGA